MRPALAVFALAATLACSSGQEPPAPEPRRADDRPAAPPPAAGSEEHVAPAPAPTGPAVILEPPGQPSVRVPVEVARTPAETQRGLMFRRQLDPAAGMLFLFRRPRQLTFWMRNTLIPLDMIFITGELRVLGVVENAEPETDDPREVEGDSQFVLEVNAGFAREHGIGPGTVVRFEGTGSIEGADE